MKPRHKRRIFWSFCLFFTVFLLCIIIIPPFLNLNHLKEKLETTILNNTGKKVEIKGNINFSLLGRITLVANNVVFENGNINWVRFGIPLLDIFHPSIAELSNRIVIDGGFIKLESLKPINYTYKMDIKNFVIEYKNKKCVIENGTIFKDNFIGNIYINNILYNANITSNEFTINDFNNGINIYGNSYKDGSIKGKLISKINLKNVFSIENIELPDLNNFKSEFYWNGENSLRIYNINSDEITGEILFEDGILRDINLNALNLIYDMSFILSNKIPISNLNLDINFYGKLKLKEKIFSHIKAKVKSVNSKVFIENIIADTTSLNGGNITDVGANNINLETEVDGINLKCIFSGNIDNWICDSLKYADFKGSLINKGNNFELTIESDKNMPDYKFLENKLNKLGSKGLIKFKFSDTKGEIVFNNKNIESKYDFVRNKSLRWVNKKLSFLPDFILDEKGDFSWKNDSIFFEPYSHNFSLLIKENSFYLNGNNLKKIFKNVDLPFVKDNLHFSISGNYSNSNISNLTITINGYNFTGSLTDNNITLWSEFLDIDNFIQKEYFDNYDENQFISQDPIILIFKFPFNLSMSIDKLLYNGMQYSKFTYSLNDNKQVFSISDNEQGSLLTDIIKSDNNYDITVKLNRFKILNKFFTFPSPLNIKGSLLTAEIKLNTNGNIAYDIWNNMNGNMNLSFEGGLLEGLGVDNFYSSSDSITILNAERMLSDLIEGGESKIKKLNITGDYNSGIFKTSLPFSLSLYHSDIYGDLTFNNKRLTSNIKLILRGSSPQPEPIDIIIYQDGKRAYSLSAIMTNFDPDFLKNFVKSHNKF